MVSPVLTTAREPRLALARADWEARAAAYADRADTLLAGHADRASRGQGHPVEDFLFTYYRLRPGQLRRWHPGAGVGLLDAADEARAGWPGYRVDDGAVWVDAAALVQQRGERIARTQTILAATQSRAASYGCFGMHEWAMLYRRPREDFRHAAWPMRLGPAEIDAVVEQRRLSCTHLDAYRFFSPAATPRNATALTRESQAASEQPGCLHAGMDLYRYAYELLPAVPSELVLDCFELARDIRRVDMQATPYDFSGLGLEPIAVEQPAGRAEYVARQQDFAHRARPLRAALLTQCATLLGTSG